MTDFRALCTELLAALEEEASNWNLEPEDHPLVERACAALAEPEPQPPSGEVAELVAWLREQAENERPGDGDALPADMLDELFNASTRLDRAADLLEQLSPPQPIPVSERLPGPEDTLRRSDATTLNIARDDEWCWGQERSLLTGSAIARWQFMRVTSLDDQAVNWLPAHALPLPSGDA